MIQGFLKALLQNDWQGAKVVHHAVLAAGSGAYAELARPLPRKLQELLLQAGVHRLYQHQAVALEQIRAGRTVVVATPTASGKSLIYNLAVAETLLHDDSQRALYLSPIKALSRDQLEALQAFYQPLQPEAQFRIAVYDGDTTPYQRSKIRQKHPHILLTNPDMLHYALLPYHSKWQSFWERLRFVVIDEMHTYRGIFGSHVGQILRRLQRICRFYGGQPQFVFLSATIANPSELAQQLIGQPPDRISVIDDHGAPQAKRHFVFLQGEESSGIAISTVAARLLARAASAGLKTIAFTQSRKLTELLHMSVVRMAPRLAKRVSSYRAGFLPEERRTIEQQLASGSLAAVISTSALEMGIDIGGLDLCLLVGYPGTVMTTWQRGGRVGRGGQESAIILLPQADALDQYVVQHPEEFLSSHYEIAITDPFNEEILKAHLPCAAAELPIDTGELEQHPAPMRQVVQELTQAGRLLQTADGQRWLARNLRPHRDVDIRSVGAAYAILKQDDADKPLPIGKSDGVRALKECHPGAIYLHRGETYEVTNLDLHNRVIHVAATQAGYFTRVKSEKETEILDILASKPAGNFIVRLGRLRVTEHITGYEKRRWFTQELLAFNPLELPPQTFETIGFWLEIETLLADHIRAAELHFMGGIHAVEHAVISMFPLFALADRNDIGGIASPHHPQVGKSAIFIYDGYPGGIGLAARGYDIILPLLEKTTAMVSACPCEEGCPSCIHSPKCGAGNKPLDKQAAIATLKYLLGEWDISRPLSAENAPTGQPPPESVEQPVAVETPTYRIGFFDLETQRLAQDVGGWQNKHLMRVSVAVLYEAQVRLQPNQPVEWTQGSFHVFKEDEVPELLKHLQQLDLVVGFNVIDFDYAVLTAYTPYDFRQLPTFDILQEIRHQLGFRLSLDHLATQSLGTTKTADGIQAVQWFRAGEWEPLIHYCKADVKLTRDLFQLALDKGYLLYCDRQGHTLRIPTSWDLRRLLKKENS